MRSTLNGDHKEFENSKWLLTIDLHNKTNDSFPTWAKFLFMSPRIECALFTYLMTHARIHHHSPTSQI